MNPKALAKLEAQAARLRKDYAAAQATADVLRARLSRAEARLSGEPMPETGLDLLWEAAPPMARKRSSKFKCRQAWLRVPQAQRPRVSTLVDAIRAWSRDPEWRKDDGQFVPALDRWIRERRWEDLPENQRPIVRAPQSKPITHQVPDGDTPATPEEIAAVLAALGNPVKPAQ